MDSAEVNNENQITSKTLLAWQRELFDGQTLRVPVEALNYWPLPEYLGAAVLQAVHLGRRKTESEHAWQSPAWDFGRFAKAHPSLHELDGDRALVEIKKAIGSEFWTRFLKMEAADGEMAFDHVWVECRAVPGYDALTVAVLDAKRLTPEMDEDGPAGYTAFLEIARSLHRQLPDGAFMLPCHKLAPMLACLPITISRYRKKALRDGHLQIVKHHTYRSAGKSEATEFVFVDLTAEKMAQRDTAAP